MTDLAYHLLDVFTDEPFSGNPLAVLVDPPPLTEAQMQAVAAEFNLSETVFVRPPEAPDGSWPTRIFTPTAELPFAGHPTVGTAVLLAHLGLVDGSVTLAEGVGDVAVTVSSEDNRPPHATLTTASPPQRLDAPDYDIVARALGISTGDMHPGFGPTGWTCGVPFLVAPVRDADVLARLHPDPVVWQTEISGSGLDGLYPIAPLDDAMTRWRSRMFGLELGMFEDPATGSAAAAVAGFLASTVRSGRPMRWEIEQGVEMGRPSRLDVSIVTDGAELRAVEVGGHAVVVGSGTLVAPPA